MALWRSVSGTQLLLAGALDEVQPLLLASGAPPKGREPGPAAALEEELQGWDQLLYKASWSPLPLAANMCLDPAITATVDQCGRL